ncbi:MAG TPA: preprotein translocase subunit SecE [Thermoleophilaceae bacterium]|nr:preprotein translocase subunit SecE [Thermoleophilaceae bacterium]
MARDRQRAKQRQAERRARRLAQQGEGSTLPGDGAAAPPEAAPSDDDASARQAPPPETTRGDIPGVTGPTFEPEQVPDDRPLTEDEAPLSEDEALQEIEDWEVEDETGAVPPGKGEEGYEVRGRRGRDAADAHKHRPRVVQFLIAVWAELQRVQWPNRQALITLTGVVLGFVLIAGGYLGLLDAVFSELIKAIL